MGEPKKIIISTGDEPPEPNSTLLALLRDGEKMKPGDPRGTLADRLGAMVQDFMAKQKSAAEYRRCAVKGKVVITLDFTTGPDGSQTYACTEKITAAKIPPRTSMTFTDDDGELTGRPAEPLIDEMHKRAGASADPKVGATSKL